ncbi:MAG: anthranilate synthase component I family protein [Phycisphaeraceae bacterium]|nr:anthranilate synthase component I family protein [Phycisphaeraceae bacterium]
MPVRDRETNPELPQPTPEQVFFRWPRREPLAALWSGDHAARTTLLANPGKPVLVPSGENPLPALRALLRAASPHGRGGWMVLLSYDAGRALEPRARTANGAADDRGWPAAVFLRIDAPLVYDHALGRWNDADRAAAEAGPEPAQTDAFETGPARSATSQGAYEAGVARVVEYLCAGDAYQVNLAHRFTLPMRGSARAFFSRLAGAANPRYGAYLEFDEPDGTRRAVCSASPELYLAYNAGTRRVQTCPMKGTRPHSASAQSLREAPKDAAELAMIVDLMRNDLGRVCVAGTMRVDHAREIERHGASPESSLWQATATISGTLASGADLADLIGATFPPGSVTGAPKIRAMQIIDELEPVRRGPYCGALGYISDSGDAAFNVAIRTALITGSPGACPGEFEASLLDYSVGAGVVVESEPRAEWLETLDKAGVLRGALAHAGQIESESSQATQAPAPPQTITVPPTTSSGIATTAP